MILFKYMYIFSIFKPLKLIKQIKEEKSIEISKIMFELGFSL
jgi:hypothetical protein